MGVPSIKEFSFPIIIGLIAGAYSSVCISGNLWYLFKTKIGKNRVIDTEVSFKEATEPDKTEKLISSVIKKEAETKAAKNNVKNKKVNVDKTKYSSQPRGKKKR